MKNFITKNFILQSKQAEELYHTYAEGEPIFDYHCHLSPAEIATNKRFRNLYDIWLAGDHYKWRAMRSNGVAEKFCTGDGTDLEKYRAFAGTVPETLRNPLYHWTHLELKRYFGISKLLNEETAEEIWDEANEVIQSPEFCVHQILDKNKVAVICTTDDPVDSLDHHIAIAGNKKLKTRVYPTFRPDKAFTVNVPEVFNAWVDQLAAISKVECGSLRAFLEALEKRHDFFHSVGGRLSDHGLESAFAEPCTEAEAARIFDKARASKVVTAQERNQFCSYMMLFFGRLDAVKGWTKQLHLGAMRNNSTRLFKKVGADIGCDSIGDYPQAQALSRYLDALDQEGNLPKVILYNLNPAWNYVFATLIGNFQDGTIPGKIQFGSGWWFLDQKEGMEMQINSLSNLGLLSRFVGMLTDSRSFLSYTRHEYFRRILCNLLGDEMVSGELPDDMELVGGMVRNICFGNAKRYFGLKIHDSF